MSSRQPSLFGDNELKPSGTTIPELKQYIGEYVDAVDVYFSTSERKRGVVFHIEKIEMNGYLYYRVELNDDAGAFLFGSIKEVIDFFESDMALTVDEFRILCQREKVCFVSQTDGESGLVYSELKKHGIEVPSITIEGMALHKDRKFLSLNRTINYRGYDIQRITIVEKDFFQMTKEFESSKVFHIVKNGGLKTVCGKSLDMLIDAQDIYLGIGTNICKRCKSLFDF